MSLRGSLDQISGDTEAKVSGLYARRQAGTLSEARFVKMSGATIDRANAKAIVTTDRAVAAQASAAKGGPARPAGLRPVSDRKRLEGAVQTTGKGPATQTGGTRGKRVERLARTEPYSSAQDALPKAAKAQGATGWTRQTNPDACPLCLTWADGRVRSFESRMLRHPGCTCLQQPVYGPKAGRLRGLVRKRPKTTATIAALILLPNPATVAAVGYAIPGSRFGRYQILRIIADTLGVDPFDIDVKTLRAHARLHEEERFRGPRRSPCWKNRNIDFAVHRNLAAAIQEKYPDTADYLLRTSPRWGRKRTHLTGLPLPEMEPAEFGWPETVEGVAEELTRRHPNLVVDFGPATSRNARLAAVAFEDMARRYPAAVASIERLDVPDHVQMATLPNQPTPAPQPWQYAHMGLTGPQGPIGQRFTHLNPVWMVDDQLARDTFAMRPTAFAQRDVDDLVRHEIGHHVFFAWTDEITRTLARRAGDPIWPDPGDPTGQNLADYWGRARAEASAATDAVVRRVTGHSMDSMSGKQAIGEEISEYAAESLDELVAEAILQVTVGKYRVRGRINETGRASELAREIVKVIDAGLDEHGIGPTGGPTPDLGGAAPVRAPKPARISAVVPTAKRAGTRAPGEGPAMHPDLIEDVAVAKTIARQAAVPGFEDFAGRTDRGALDEIIDRQAGFLVAAAERSWAISPEATALHADWYPFAHGWLNDLADVLGGRHGVTRNGAYAATAALSAQTDWADVAWAKRVIEAITDDVIVEAHWIRARYAVERSLGKAQGRGGGRPRLRRDLIGKRLSELSTDDVAIVLRGWHDHEPVYQLGGHAGFGNPDNLTRPQSFENLTKAVQVLRDGSLENIDRTLGGQKIRSFYNNLAHPFDIDDLNVTVDSHHFGVANGYPWTTSSRFLDTKAGSINLTDTPTSGTAGVAGTYPLVVQATRRATTIFNEIHGTNYLPNQMQSIVWEQHRAEFPSEVRRDPPPTAKSPGPGRYETMMKRLEAIRTARALQRITRDEEWRLVQVAIYRGGAARPSEILEMYLLDLAGINRPSVKEIREAKQMLLMKKTKGQ